MRSLFAWLLPIFWLLLPEASSGQRSAEPVFEVIDLRVGLVQDFQSPGRNLWQGIGQGGIVQLRRGHVAGALIPLSPSSSEASSAALALRFTRFRSALGSTQAFDARPCSARGKRISAWFELEAPEQLASDPDSVTTWVARGARVIALAGRSDGALATSAFPNGATPVVGLTPVGRRVTELAMRAGALIDVANLSDVAVLEVLDLARAQRVPVITTRGSARAVRSRAGSLEDWQLQGIAKSGGVIGLSFDRELVGDAADAELSDFLRQLDHVLHVAGPEAVALASGFETSVIPAPSLNSAARFPRLARALLAHGLAVELVQKLMFENARRVLCEGTSAQSGSGSTLPPG